MGLAEISSIPILQVAGANMRIGAGAFVGSIYSSKDRAI